MSPCLQLVDLTTQPNARCFFAVSSPNTLALATQCCYLSSRSCCICVLLLFLFCAIFPSGCATMVSTLCRAPLSGYSISDPRTFRHHSKTPWWGGMHTGNDESAAFSCCYLKHGHSELAEVDAAKVDAAWRRRRAEADGSNTTDARNTPVGVI